MRAGVDEAGRGPVLGPLVVACVAGDPTHLPARVDDSKALDATTRERLHGALTSSKELTVRVRTLPAASINEHHAGGGTLDGLETRAFAELLEAIGATRATVDTVGPEPEAFQRRLEATLDGCRVTARVRADETDPLVQAASVVAKHERDQRIRQLEEDVGEPIGSGYPSDPATRAFLEAWREQSSTPPPFARKRWSTLDELGFGSRTLTEFTGGKR